MMLIADNFSRSFTLVILMLLGTGCTLVPSQGKFEPDEQLLDGRLLFGHTVEAAPEENFLTVSDDMRAFISSSVNADSMMLPRFRQLMSALVENGFYVDQYDRSATYDAATTFAVRKGNCLSYTNLFVALAREIGLDAQFQLVHGVPTWSARGGFVVRNNHVNVVVRRMNLPGQPRGEVTVDFNDVLTDDKLRTNRISDTYGASLHYTNLAIDHLQNDDAEQAFAYLKRAILVHPQNPDLWINLGVLYAEANKYEYAEALQRTALSLDPRNKAAIAGLSNSLSAQGRKEEAAVFTTLANRYQRKNPYFYFAIAQRAYGEEDYKGALLALDDAIRLKRTVANFYRLRAAAAYNLGDEQLMNDSLELRNKYARRAKTRAATEKKTTNWFLPEPAT